MAERSFAKEVEQLRLGEGEIFRGEGILAVTKALLQSGVSYVGGYQGAPASHLLDVLVQAEDLLAELGIKLETCTRSEEHTSELHSRQYLVCRLLLEKKRPARPFVSAFPVV